MGEPQAPVRAKVHRFDHRLGESYEESLMLDSLDTIRIYYGEREDQYAEIRLGKWKSFRVQSYSSTDNMAVCASGGETIDVVFIDRGLG